MAGLSAFMADQPQFIPSYVGKNFILEIPSRQRTKLFVLLLPVLSLCPCLSIIPVVNSRKQIQTRLFIHNLFLMGGFIDKESMMLIHKQWDIIQSYGCSMRIMKWRVNIRFLHVASSLADPLSSTIACVASDTARCTEVHRNGLSTNERYRQRRNVPTLISRVKAKEGGCSDTVIEFTRLSTS